MREVSRLSGRSVISPIIVLFALVVIISFTSANAVENKSSYTDAEMPEVMAATWEEDVIGDDTEKETILSLLERGQLVIINEHPKKTKWLISAGVLVNARPQTLFEVITDTENYSKFMPMTQGAKTVTRGPNIVELNLTLKIKILKGLPAIPVNYSVLHCHRPPYRSDWTYYSGRFERNDGFYRFVPVEEGNRTMAFYTVYSLPRLPIATKMFKNDPNLEFVVNMSTAAMVTRSLKKRAEEVENRKPFVPGKGMKGNTIDAMTRDSETVKLLLARGGLILIEEGPPMWATTAVSIDAPPEAVFRDIARFEDYPCYISQVVESKVVERSATTAKTFFMLIMDYVVLKIKLKYELAYTFKPPQHIEWKWASGDVPGQKGSWTLFPLDGGKRTLALLRQTEDLRTLPGVSGAGLRAAIGGQPSLEPAVLGSQALITARSIRDFLRLTPEEKKAKIDNCNAGE